MHKGSQATGNEEERKNFQNSAQNMKNSLTFYDWLSIFVSQTLNNTKLF